MTVKEIVKNAMKAMNKEKDKAGYFYKEAMYLLSTLEPSAQRVAGENLLNSAVVYLSVIEG